MVIGLFNVVSAIFVEATMDAASKLQIEKRKLRRSNFDLWAKNIETIIQKLFQHMPEHKVGNDLMSKHLDKIMEMEVPRKTFDEVIKDKEFAACLVELDL